MKRAWAKGLLSIAASAAFVTLAVCALRGAPAREESQREFKGHRHHSRAEKRARASGEKSGVRVSAGTAAFDGKIVVLEIRGSTSPKLLAEARFEETGSRTFLVGTEVKSTSSVPLDADSHVAWDSVDAFYLFESVEQYESAINKALAAQGAIRHIIDGARDGIAVCSVQVRIVDPANRLNGRGERLAKAVMKRIEEVTPMRVCDSDADTTLSCAIGADSEAVTQEPPYTPNPRESKCAITVAWTDRDGNLLQPRASFPLPEIASLSNAFPELGQELAMDQAKSLRNAAEQIVQVVEESW